MLGVGVLIGPVCRPLRMLGTGVWDMCKCGYDRDSNLAFLEEVSSEIFSDTVFMTRFSFNIKDAFCCFVKDC